MGRRLSLILAIGAALWASPGVAAGSQAPSGTAKLDPATPSAGAHLLLDAQGADGGGFHRQEIPTALAIDLQKGFAFEPSAVTGICSDDQAGNEQCPPNSIVGTGTLDVLAEGYAFGPNGQNFTAQLTFYRANPRQPGDPMGVVFQFREPSSGFHGASIGRLTTLDDPILGPQLRWDQLPIPKLPPGMSFTLQRLRVDIGAGTATPPQRVKPKKKRKHRCRKVTRRTRSGRKKTVFVCPKKHRKKSTKRTTAHKAQAGALLTNPPTCTGSWRVRLEITYKDGTELRDADAPCQAAAGS
jgi:hypothetical protein